MDRRWQEAFSGWVLQTTENYTVLSGDVPDQAALYGLLDHLRDLNLTIISIDQIDETQEGKE
jgi:hypothetical protein